MSPPDDRRRLVRATIVNSLGTIAEGGRAAVPMALIALYSSSAFGVLAVALAWVEILQRLVVTGFSDGVQFLLARDDGRRERAGEVSSGDAAPAVAFVGSGLVLGLAMGGALAAAAGLAAGALHAALYGATQPGAFVTTLRVLAWSLPFQAVASIPLAALKARLRMGPDVAVNSLLQPAAVVGAAVLLRGRMEAPVAMAAAYVAGTAVGAVLALAAFGRRERLRDLPAAAFRAVGTAEGRRGSRALAAFALPQGASAVATVAMSRVDALVLAAFVAPAAVAFYSVAAELARLPRTVKLNFGTVLSPLVARHAGSGDRTAVQAAVDTVTGWTLAVAAPVVFLLLAFREELFHLYGQHGPAPFFALLLAGPVASGVLGFAGNVLMMTGHVRLTLANTLVALAANLALALALVPRWGLGGAAAAAAAAQVLLLAVQALQARHLSGLRLPLGALVRPGVSSLVFVGAGLVMARTGSVAGRVGLAVAALLAYAALVGSRQVARAAAGAAAVGRAAR
jgi:O-antigen/teichoic acid export membrane protein